MKKKKNWTNERFKEKIVNKIIIYIKFHINLGICIKSRLSMERFKNIKRTSLFFPKYDVVIFNE